MDGAPRLWYYPWFQNRNQGHPAPAHIVDGLKKQAAETQLLLDKAKEALAALPSE